jgi:hypothetical protein
MQTNKRLPVIVSNVSMAQLWTDLLAVRNRTASRHQVERVQTWLHSLVAQIIKGSGLERTEAPIQLTYEDRQDLNQEMMAQFLSTLYAHKMSASLAYMPHVRAYTLAYLHKAVTQATQVWLYQWLSEAFVMVSENGLTTSVQALSGIQPHSQPKAKRAIKPGKTAVRHQQDRAALSGSPESDQVEQPHVAKRPTADIGRA